MDLLGFALAVLLIELVPGPNMAWLVMLSLSEGRRAGFAAIAGIAAGLAVNAATSALAASFLLQQSEALSKGIAVLGALMMTWLARESWRSGGEPSPGAVPANTERRNLIAGFTINALNPKAALFFLTVMPQFMEGGRPSYMHALSLGAVSVVIATLVHMGLVGAAGTLRPLVVGNQRASIVRRALAIVMLGVGVWFLAKAFV
jgi:threonine/homoserine/homoserine lactone efflux protein